MNTNDTTANIKLIESSNRLKNLIVPVDAQHPLLKAIWFHFHSKASKRLADSTFNGHVRNTNRFVNFLKDKGYTSIDNTPDTVFNEWGKQINTKSAYYSVQALMSMADKYLKHLQGTCAEINIHQSDFLSRAVQKFSLQIRPSDKKLPLSQMFLNCPYPDDEMLLSLRLVAANLILLEQQTKDLILSQEGCGHYDSLDCREVSKTEYRRFFISYSAESREFYRPVFKSILTANIDYAKESILHEIIYNHSTLSSIKGREFKFEIDASNVNELYDELLTPVKNKEARTWFSRSDLDEIREKLVNTRPTRSELAEKYELTDSEVRAIIAGNNTKKIISPSVVQKIKTEYSKPKYSRTRAEKEYAISRKSLMDFLNFGIPEPELIPKQLSIESIGISSSAWRCSSYVISNLTSINHIQTWAFAVLLATEGLQITGLQLLTLDDIKETASASGKQTIQFDYVKNRTGPEASLTVAKNSTAVHSNKDRLDVFYRAFSCAASQVRNSLNFRADGQKKYIFNLSSDPGVFNDFLNRKEGKKLTKRLLNNDSVLRRELQKVMSTQDLQPFLWLLGHINQGKGNKTLPVSPIHESFVLIGAINKPNTHLAEVRASLSSHTNKTDEDIYLARYPRVVKEKLSNTPAFSFRVAQMMSEFADGINAIQSKNKVLTKQEIKELLGIHHISDAIDTGMLGELSLDQMTVYVANNSTAALILRRLDHLKAELPRIVQHQRSDKRLVNDVVKEFIHLSDVLTQFPENLILEGEQYAKKLRSVLFPPIV